MKSFSSIFFNTAPVFFTVHMHALCIVLDFLPQSCYVFQIYTLKISRCFIDQNVRYWFTFYRSISNLVHRISYWNCIFIKNKGQKIFTMEMISFIWQRRNYSCMSESPSLWSQIDVYLMWKTLPWSHVELIFECLKGFTYIQMNEILYKNWIFF